MKKRFENFLRDQQGAVTVDWVVLTAAVVGLGVAIGVAMTNGTTALSDDIWSYLDSLDLFS